MNLVRGLTIFMVMHVGFGLTALIMAYVYAGQINWGGDAGFFAYSPLQEHFDADAGRVERQLGNLADIKGIFQRFIDLGDTLWGLMAFEFGIITDFRSDDKLLFWIALLFRAVGWVGTIWTTVGVAQLVFSSGILQSQLGLLLLGAGISGISGLSILGALN